MPHLLHKIPEDQRSDAIEAIIAFLSGTEAEEPKIVASGGNPVAHEFWLKGDVERGRVLYHQVGCIACHAIDSQFVPAKTAQSDLERKIESLGLEPDELEELGLVLPKPVNPTPMSSIPSKYSLRSLSMFLIAPHLVRPAGRMPSLKLQPHEAADIAAYLFRNPSEQSYERSVEQKLPRDTDSNVSKRLSNIERIDQGRKLFDELACANCHAHPLVKPRLSKPLADLDLSKGSNSCLEQTNSGPRYDLSDNQKVALKTSITRLQTSKSPNESDSLNFKLLQLNCYACHERGGRGGVGPAQGAYFENVQQVDIGDEGRMPPSLDHVGRKLSKAWIQKILEGNGDVRPHFRARMPVFAEHSKSLAASLVAADISVPLPGTFHEKIANASDGDLEAGRQLLDAGCVQCHALRGEALPGSIGIDLADIAIRMEPEWFHAFLLNPASLKKNTRMPSFFPEGKSSNPHILNGDVSLQIASLWRYLNAKDQPLPAKLEQSRSHYFELKPIDKPTLLRTFMESASGGTHAIAVGFPEQRHFAFDAKRLRLAELWKGRFLNAQGTWFDRFAPPAIPLGDQRILLAKNSFVHASKDETIESVDPSIESFQGFVLDRKGIPTFRYQVGAVTFEDRIEPIQNQGLSRTISTRTSSSTTDTQTRPLWLVVTDEAVAINPQGVCSTRSNLKIYVSEGVEHQSRKHGDSFDWMIAIPKQPGTIEVRYQW
jgi:mono/diheme cytochrome c family protein